MTSFKVITLGEFMIGKQVEIAIKAFSAFYHDLTSKHQKKCSLVLIDKEEFINPLKDFASKHEIDKAIEFLSWEEQEKIKANYEDASVMFLPLRESTGRILPEALSFSLPVLSYKCKEVSEYVDMTCSMLCDYNSDEQNILAFAEMLRLIYFDPEARKILSKGALKKYETSFSWGKHKGRAVAKTA